jgi:hypothetical protein
VRQALKISINGGKMLGGEMDAAAEKLVGKGTTAGKYAEQGVEMYQLYRNDDLEGMAVYGSANFAEEMMDKAVEAAIGPELVPAWRFGRGVGGLIKKIPFNGVTIEDRVTDFYFRHLDGRRADEQFAEITSEESIEKHRQKLHAERLRRFSDMSGANQQAAAAKNAALAAEVSAANDAALANSMMNLMVIPAITSAAAAASTPSYPPVPSATTPPVVPYSAQPDRFAAPNDGRRVEAWQPSPLGSTFGSPPASLPAQRSCPRQCTHPGCNIECN